MTDQLEHVKGFFAGVVLAGFGARTYITMDRAPEYIKVLHNFVVPGLYNAILSHDPGWDPDAEIRAGHWVVGGPQTSLSEATGTQAVRWFAELLEFTKAFHRHVDTTSDWYDALFVSSNQVGCFLDGLVAALQADDPSWRG